MRIRPARLPDLEAVLALGRQAHAESRQASLPRDEDKVRALLEEILRGRKGAHCVLLAESDDGRPVGFLAGQVVEYFFCRQRIAQNIVFYVLPEYRGRWVAVKLLYAFRGWARHRGAVELHVGITTGVEVARFDRFLRRLGFHFVGGNYVLALPTGAEARPHAPAARH